MMVLILKAQKKRNFLTGFKSKTVIEKHIPTKLSDILQVIDEKPKQKEQRSKKVKGIIRPLCEVPTCNNIAKKRYRDKKVYSKFCDACYRKGKKWRKSQESETPKKAQKKGILPELVEHIRGTAKHVGVPFNRMRIGGTWKPSQHHYVICKCKDNCFTQDEDSK